MPHVYRALVTDYDGTIAHGPRPEPDVLAALAAMRDEGRRVVLATGRTLAHLRRDFPDVDAWFDAIVAENGAMLWTPERTRPLAPAVPEALADALRRRGVPVERGDVLLATYAAWDRAALDEISRLGLDCQLVHNRGALMILPAAVSKGTGAREALAELGISFHSAVALGDAENDHSLFDACEIGVAVGDAVPALKAHADVVVSGADGAGVASFLRGPVLGGMVRVQPKRWRVTLGAHDDGTPATLPASQLNLLIAGKSGAGKSHLAGLFAEQLVALQYSVCVIDPEGDHEALGKLRGFVTVGGPEPLPSPQGLVKLLRHRFGSVVADLSMLGEEERTSYARKALEAILELRRDTGLPHWIVLDEAHVALDHEHGFCPCSAPLDKGFCLVTWVPGQLCAHAVRAMDALAILGGADPEGGHARARLLPRFPDGASRSFTVAGRASPHVRHWHKYAAGQLPFAHRFFFRAGARPTGVSAGNLAEFHTELVAAGGEVIEHHAMAHDFSRWIREVLRDRRLAEAAYEIEGAAAQGAVDVDEARGRLLSLVERRYLTPAAP